MACLLVAGIAGAAAPQVDRLDAHRERVRALEAELVRIDADAGESADAAAARGRRVRALHARIAVNGRESRRAKVDQRHAQDRLAQRLVAIYTAGEPDAIAVLLSSDSLSDAIEARDVRERVSRHDARLVDTLHRARTRLAAARRALIAERAEAAVAEREARAHLREVEDVRAGAGSCSTAPAVPWTG